MEEKVSLPIKTKIAAWMIILTGIIGGVWVALFNYILSSWSIGASPLSEIEKIIEMVRIFLPYFILIFLPGFFLLKTKKLAWWFAVFSSIFSSIVNYISSPFLKEILYPILYGYPQLPLVIPLLIIFILLLLDRKNFWKVAT